VAVRCGGCGDRVNGCKYHNIELFEDDRVPSAQYYICVGDANPHWAVCPNSDKVVQGRPVPWHYITAVDEPPDD
jgi:hypothetical protein